MPGRAETEAFFNTWTDEMLENYRLALIKDRADEGDSEFIRTRLEIIEKIQVNRSCD